MLAESEPVKYPAIYVEKIDPWPDVPEDAVVEFRLTYKGRLPAVSRNDPRAADKHRIRRELHRQLKTLWETHQTLRPAMDEIQGHRPVDIFSKTFEKCGYKFMPLINSSDEPWLFDGRFNGACALDILFLRRDQPGNLVKHGGDIDNRIKVLFDALQVPVDCSQVSKSPPSPDEVPLFCLLSDDRLITEVKVTTDRLLTPKNEEESINDVELVIGVRTVLYGSWLNPLG